MISWYLTIVIFPVCTWPPDVYETSWMVEQQHSSTAATFYVALRGDLRLITAI